MRETIEEVHEEVRDREYSVEREDLERPWGGFVVLKEANSRDFISFYFGDGIVDVDTMLVVTPKYLLIAPGKRLSWQYHHRRSECWRVIRGRVGVMRSRTDEQPEEIEYHEKGDMIMIDREERHRLIGLEEWAVVAEIWIHTDAAHPSEEKDIVRVQDDFQRN